MPQFRESVGLIERIQALARKGGFQSITLPLCCSYDAAAQCICFRSERDQRVPGPIDPARILGKGNDKGLGNFLDIQVVPPVLS